MKRKRNQYSTTLEDGLAEEFEECLKITGLDPSSLMKETIRAFVREVKTKGGIWLPLRIVPREEKKPAALPAEGSRLIVPPEGPIGLSESSEKPNIALERRRNALRKMPLKKE